MPAGPCRCCRSWIRRGFQAESCASSSDNSSTRSLPGTDVTRFAPPCIQLSLCPSFGGYRALLGPSALLSVVPSVPQHREMQPGAAQSPQECSHAWGPMAQGGQQQGLLLGSSCIFGTLLSHPLLEPFIGAPPFCEAALAPLIPPCCTVRAWQPLCPSCALGDEEHLAPWSMARPGSSVHLGVTLWCCPWDLGPWREHKVPEAVQVAAHHAQTGKSRQQ